MNTSIRDNVKKTAAICDELFILARQKEALCNRQKDGIILPTDAEDYANMTKKERTLKTTYVLSRHITSDGQARRINAPTGTIKGWSTHIEGKKRITAKTYDDLIDKLYDIYTEGTQGTTFHNIFRLALADKAKFKSAGTIAKYEADYTRFIESPLSEALISQIGVQMLRDYTISMMQRVRPSSKAYRAYKGVLNLTFQYAVSHDFIEYNVADRLNDADFYPLCTNIHKTAEDKAMSPEQIADLTEEVYRRIARPKQYGECYTTGYMYLLSTMTGMRSGELCSLKWTDITDKSIHIHTQQLKNRRTNAYEYALWTKNEKGISRGGRYFPITEPIRQLFAEIREAQKRAGIQSEWVFAKEDGTWIPSDTCYQKFLKRLCESKGYPITNNHAIRMYFNSYVLVPKNIPVTNRAKVLGHSVEVNLRNYSFADYDYCTAVMEALDGSQVTPGDTQNVIPFQKRNASTPHRLRHF